MTDGYSCVDIQRFYISYRLPCEHVRPTRSGLGLRLDEWAHLLELIPLFTNVIRSWLPQSLVIRIPITLTELKKVGASACRVFGLPTDRTRLGDTDYLLTLR